MPWAFSASSGQVMGISLATAPIMYSSTGISSTWPVEAFCTRITSSTGAGVAAGGVAESVWDAASLSGVEAAGVGWAPAVLCPEEDDTAACPAAWGRRLTSGRQKVSRQNSRIGRILRFMALDLLGGAAAVSALAFSL